MEIGCHEFKRQGAATRKALQVLNKRLTGNCGLPMTPVNVLAGLWYAPLRSCGASSFTCKELQHVTDEHVMNAHDGAAPFASCLIRIFRCAQMHNLTISLPVSLELRMKQSTDTLVSLRPQQEKAKLHSCVAPHHQTPCKSP
eukprot:1153088-Pelagomonas_calceolata.AAC.13